MNLSGGELQRVAITLALGKPVGDVRLWDNYHIWFLDIYLIDEPSAYLDSEQRIICAKVIKRCVVCSSLLFSFLSSLLSLSVCVCVRGATLLLGLFCIPIRLPL